MCIRDRLALGPMNHEFGVIDKIESKVEQQMRAVSSIEACIAECAAMRKPRMQEAVMVRYLCDPMHCHRPLPQHA